MLTLKQEATLRNFRISYHPHKSAYARHMDGDFRKICLQLVETGHLTAKYEDRELKSFVLNDEIGERNGKNPTR